MEAAIDSAGWLLMQWLEHVLDRRGEPPVKLVADTVAYLERQAPDYMESVAADLDALMCVYARVSAPGTGSA